MSRRPKIMKKGIIIAENEQLLKEVNASRQLHEHIIQELQKEIDLLNRQVIHYKDDMVYGANFVKELKGVIEDYEVWYDRRIKKYVDGGDNGNSSNHKTD